jgi:indolepyruvate ferredoxin oxidoreductase
MLVDGSGSIRDFVCWGHTAAEIASIPEHIRGYGHVKEAHLHKAKAREAALLAKWNNPREIPLVQAA